MITFSPLNYVFCEGFRQESGNKLMLYGVAPDVTTSQIPIILPIAVWVDAMPDGIGNFQFDLRFIDEQENVLASAKFEGENIALTRTSFPIGPIPIEIKAEGPVIFQWKFGENNWEKVGELTIRKGPIA